MRLLNLTSIVFSVVSFLPLLLFSQTGPGGIGSSTNNVVWFDANSFVYNDAGSTLCANGQTVQQWNDVSGNSRNLIQTTSSRRPAYVTNVINGKPVIRYTAASGHRMLATGVATGNAATIWAVVKYSSLPSSNPGIIHAAPAGSAFSTSANEKSIGMWVSSSNLPWGRGVQSDNNSRNISTVTTTSVNTFYIICNTYDGSTNINQYINGSSSGSTTYNGTLKSWSDFGVGCQANESWNGDIAEVIAYNTYLNTAQRTVIDNYLSAKFNISIPVANDIYTMDNTANGDFDFEVAGIGQAADGSSQTSSRGSGIVEISSPSALTNNEFFIWGHDNGNLGPNFSDLPSGIQVKLARTWRPSEQGEVGNFDISFDLSGLGPVTASDLRLLIDKDNDGIFSDETAGTGGVISGATNASGNIYQFTGININSGERFTVASSNYAQTPLPIELLDFSARANVENIVELNWTTISEINNDHFWIERSSDGVDFHGLYQVKGAGNSSEHNYYSYMDLAPFNGTSYYRLKQVDFDGDCSYSETRSVEIYPLNNDEIVLFPNLLNQGDNVPIQITNFCKDNFNLDIFDLNGTNYFSRSCSVPQNPECNYEFTLSTLPVGTYFVKISADDILISRKLIIQ